MRTVSYAWQVDGKEHPVSGSPLLDSIQLERVDNLTAAATLKHGGKGPGKRAARAGAGWQDHDHYHHGPEFHGSSRERDGGL